MSEDDAVLEDEDGGDEVEAPGWDAIDAALAPLYGDAEPLHFGTVIKWMLGGPDPLDGISVYPVDEPTPHWHFVSYGLSELYQKETEDPECSGYGFELTFRLARAADARGVEDVPRWALSFLQNLARYVFETGNVFDVGHKMDLNGPIALSEETAIRAIAFQADPQLAARDTPHGRVAFLQVVGLTLDEHQAATAWDAARFLAALGERAPLGVTDLARASLLAADPALRALVEEGVRRDGSSQGSLAVPHLVLGEDGGRATVEVGAKAAEGLRDMLRGRTGHGRPFWIVGRGVGLGVFPAEEAAPGWATDEDGDPCVRLSPEGAVDLAERLAPGKAGRYAQDDWELVVVPSEIRDADGEVVEVIG